MTNKELVLETLEELGYKPTIDDDGDIMIRYQMKCIYVAVNNDEEQFDADIEDSEQFVAVFFPNFCEVKEGEETLALAACNKLNRDIKLLKVALDMTFNQATASCETFYTDKLSLKNHLKHALEILSVVRTMYHEAKEELSK